MGGRENERFPRQREIVDLWWLTGTITIAFRRWEEHLTAIVAARLHGMTVTPQTNDQGKGFVRPSCICQFLHCARAPGYQN